MSTDWMTAPDSAIREGKRWGRATRSPSVIDGKRVQYIGDKIIYHDTKPKKEAKEAA